MAEVTYDQASRVYPGNPPVRAVDKLSLEIKDGEFLVLVGPSGSGKSTALRMLAGLEDINEGRILIGGRDVTNVPPKNRDIAMVFQSYALYPHMTVAENMGFALKLRGISKPQIAAKVKEAAGLLDLEPYLDRKPKALSGGQRQRVAMGRAIVREPSVFLMDEPLSNLDAKLRVETRANIAELQARLGTTTVYVTHDQVEAMTMGHRVAVLKDGQLQQCDTPRTLYDRPANVFVAGFMGSPAMNLLTVPLVADGAQVGETMVPLPRELLSEAHSNGLKQVVFGVRPENIALGGEGIPVKVDLVEELGADSFVHGHGPDGDRIVIRTEAHVHPTSGATVRISVADEKHIHVFNPDTGLRLNASEAVPADAVSIG
ncbi:MAG: sugar ABC transporter ATP-binding protein [Actinobacteria bacterium 69-20]|nr:sn-glycerol-3-phosphate ABC transporter ATP-binding protein UgpC [Actinomycetota bacterium]OJV23528.1 MAG: sugar ABC transporter ATP-binding protein [Actinobacteria bacterium 69-20]